MKKKPYQSFSFNVKGKPDSCSRREIDPIDIGTFQAVRERLFCDGRMGKRYIELKWACTYRKTTPRV